jgi:hypothetical protein
VIANKPDIKRPFIKMNHCYDSIFISGHIKNKPVIAYAVTTIKCFFNAMKILPVTDQSGIVPFKQRFFSHRINIIEVYKLSF